MFRIIIPTLVVIAAVQICCQAAPTIQPFNSQAAKTTKSFNPSDIDTLSTVDESDETKSVASSSSALSNRKSGVEVSSVKLSPPFASTSTTTSSGEDSKHLILAAVSLFSIERDNPLVDVRLQSRLIKLSRKTQDLQFHRQGIIEMIQILKKSLKFSKDIIYLSVAIMDKVMMAATPVPSLMIVRPTSFSVALISLASFIHVEETDSKIIKPADKMLSNSAALASAIAKDPHLEKFDDPEGKRDIEDTVRQIHTILGSSAPLLNHPIVTPQTFLGLLFHYFELRGIDLRSKSISSSSSASALKLIDRNLELAVTSPNPEIYTFSSSIIASAAFLAGATKAGMSMDIIAPVFQEVFSKRDVDPTVVRECRDILVI